MEALAIASLCLVLICLIAVAAVFFRMQTLENRVSELGAVTSYGFDWLGRREWRH